jgi:hypothetical protein
VRSQAVSLMCCSVLSDTYHVIPRRFQVVSQFASVVTSTSENASGSSSSGYSSSATTFAAGLGLSNLDVLNFVPVSCLFPETSFYDALVFKTLSPMVVLALLWMNFAYRWIAGKSCANARRTAAKWSLVVLEFIVSSVSTTVMATFQCIEYDDDNGEIKNDDLYLRAELTLACDGSTKRRLYMAYAGCMVALFPIGGHMASICCHTRRSCVMRVLLPVQVFRSCCLLSCTRIGKISAKLSRA